MVELEIEGTTATVHVTGTHRVLALREHVRFDLAHVTGIGPAPVDMRPPWLRAPGTFFPGVIAAGIFRGKGRKEFWDTRFDGRAVLVELAGTDFTRLVVDVEDPEATLRTLTRAARAA
ncbi:hypothetical protein IU501_22525 [Nocardia otitidiscaviarum]|uniref:Bacterial Pleckstrin homology domain-containing protein n=1 Tax=Nocardia otitidiscaviarum TaxID=1823 RepID=A0A378YCI0_9NOCA|nr:hypothetical protein [Nocardia otitidiscaviarum]MBF6135770.1 hypothetical protein [Nocardia otitidiscaviarum]MBF6178684.1 hypothetical protein [Nocardia otitidiscaviarum]MBF6483583.1 hypothetical protein [Nocardia otitidiscaviarum]MCP9622046.1 hypothetical protein [Nocardia otitidiscaviarum]QDP82636.1 hypothetical protein FOH10_31845 [Nocardia otitidiscaviarum]